MKIKMKIWACIILFTTLFSFLAAPIVNASDEEAKKGTSVIGALADVAFKRDYTKLGTVLLETLVKIITPAGDAFLDMICVSVGEVATIDRAVYNRMEKVDIDFFDGDTNASGDTSLTKPLKNTMKPVVNAFYSLFRKLAIVVLLVILVYVGVKLLLTSTAEKKANYQSVLMCWVMGVLLLVFFPYVMKYTIQINGALCTWIGGSSEIAQKPIKEKAPATYGKDTFVTRMLQGGEDDIKNGENAMMYIRKYGRLHLDLPLLIVYFIMIGQLLAILIMYYKRVFMLAFLIAVFPLVAMIYPLNKMGDVKMNPFGTWFKEFAVNVFVQSFHAATYRVVVTVGITSYVESGNWLFMILCILFLFQGEKIIRAIFNAKSSMNSIGDMAMAGALAMNIAKSAGNLVPDLSKKKGDKDDDINDSAEKKAKKDRIPVTPPGTPGAQANLSAAGGLVGGSAAGTTGAGGGTATNPQGVQLGRNPGASRASTPFTAVAEHIENIVDDNKLGKAGETLAKAAGTAFNLAAQTTGATMGLTYGMAQSDPNAAAGGLVSGASTGKLIGSAGKGLMVGAATKAAEIHAGKQLAEEYEDGKYDEELGITPDMEAEKQQKIREAYAKLARSSSGFGSKEGAQLKFIKERLDIERK